jgi:alpha-L-fucosidase 2
MSGECISMSELSTPVLRWDFPLPRTHTGVLLGNGIQGLMVWGESTLNITVGRAGFWDHRGGNAFASRTTYAEVRRLLEANDEAGIRRAFAPPNQREGYPKRPTQIGGGRLELRFASGFRPVRADLDTSNALLRVTLADAGGSTAVVIVRQAMDQELAWLTLDQAAHGAVGVALIPAWDYIGDHLASVGVPPPQLLDSPGGGGFCQRLPDDDPLALAWELRGTELVIVTALGGDAATQAQQLARSADTHAAAERADAWWRSYWQDLPRVRLPDPGVQHTWDYGVYKLAGLTTPGGVAASLQGPWLEEYQMLPWSSDYHFNINIQMIYWPCLCTGRFDHLWPLWKMIAAWMPQLQYNASHFFGAADALMMPHAVDDRCAVVGTFWTGTIDQACTAWMAQLAWLHYRYSLDQRVLRDVAWPLLTGAFNGYWAMLEPVEANGTRRLSLPVSVSPEYNGAGMNAWGRDASFQLAALHFLAQALPQAAQALGAAVDPRWARVRAELPLYTLTGPEQSRRIGLWQGQDLDESHRHHAHLAAIYPFGTIDPADPAHAQAVRNTIDHWVRRGAGAWTGWCIPWATILCARCNLPDAAVLWLHWWKELFTNEGHGTLHDAAYPGFTVFSPTNPLWAASAGPSREVMQIEAGMGALSAIQELLVQCQGDTIAVLPAIPQRWPALEFDGIWVEGAFRIGATVAAGRTQEVRVLSTAGGHLTLAHGIDGAWTLDGQPHSDALLECDTTPGQQLVLRRAV